MELKRETLLALVQFRATTHRGRVRSSMHDVRTNLTSHPLTVKGYVIVIDLRSQSCISYSVISGNCFDSSNLNFIKIRSQHFIWVQILPFVLF